MIELLYEMQVILPPYDQGAILVAVVLMWDVRHARGFKKRRWEKAVVRRWRVKMMSYAPPLFLCGDANLCYLSKRLRTVDGFVCLLIAPCLFVERCERRISKVQ